MFLSLGLDRVLTTAEYITTQTTHNTYYLQLLEDTMPKEKLREEVVAPYKQNWIGIFSVFIVVLSVIGNAFPELLQNPIIRIPDL